MGYMRHHAIVVCSWNDDHIEEAHRYAQNLFKWVSPISPGVTNGYRAFFIPPDGSKEWWPQSDAGNTRRKQFIAWIRMRHDEEIENPLWLDWVEVQFGDDERISKVTDHSGAEPGVIEEDPK